MMQYTLKLKCPACGYIDEGIIHEAKSVYQARNPGLHCPHHEAVEMEVVEIASSGEGILWQDLAWLREDERMAREIDSWGHKGQRKSKPEKRAKS